MNTHHVRGASGLVAVEQVGWEGTPVVALHGAGGNASQWNAVAKGLRPRRFITIDLRGHGRSEAPADERYDVQAMAADVRAVADALDLRSFVIVGHGAAGAVALETALSDSRVCGACLVEVPLGATIDEADEGLAARLRKELQNSVPDAVSGLVSAVRAYDFASAFAAYRGPMRVLEATTGARWLHLTQPSRVLEALAGLA